MTLKEAKKILKKEGFVLERFQGVLVEDVKTASWEKIAVSEAMKVVAENGYFPFMEESKYKERKARLEKEYEKNTKAPGSAENRIKEDSGVNPALNESASQFNDALLDEQAKKIAELTEEKERLEDKITIFNIFKKRNDEAYRRQIRSLDKEISKLNGIIHDKNAILSDVAEELRLTKIREKNLTEVGQKYMKENEELREKVAEKTKLVEMVRKGSKEYCEYGIAAEKMIQKMAKVIVGKGFICSEDFEKYCLWANGYRFNPQLPDFSEEEEKKLSLFRDDSVGAVTNQKDCSPVKDTHPAVDIAEEGADHSGVIVLCCKDFIDALKKMK